MVRDRARSVFAEYGRPVPLRDVGEDILAYRKKIVRALQPETTSYADRDVRSVPAELFSPIEQKVYQEATANRWHPSDLKPDQMREVVKLDKAGRKVSEFVTGRGSKGFFKEIYAEHIAPGVISAIHQFDADGNVIIPPSRKA
ncbi:hypothetical protein PAMC26510_16545 [Caballeronia sordidicola]|uniref:Uncharacterized protein n=2 Tax=Caballeronia sordidicola TaxID=196367 RepID=A0A242MTQ9_CABSO|nr:hypothetical protein PAMC26510_16545 [Caballeronia sordidicola]